MKYIMMRRPLGEGAMHQYVPVIFPDVLAHVIMAESFVIPSEHRGFKAVSAGFLTVDAGFPLPNFKCFGESESLKLKSDPERDAEIMKMMDYGGCIR